MARLRHVAVCVRDLERSARFYETVFNLERMGVETIDLGSAIYLSDGSVNLALIVPAGGYEAAHAAGNRVGTNHFGFIVDDVDETRRRIEANGGTFFFTLGDAEKHNFELKFKDPDGIVFDISKKGWLGTGPK